MVTRPELPRCVTDTDLTPLLPSGADQAPRVPLMAVTPQAKD